MILTNLLGPQEQSFRDGEALFYGLLDPNEDGLINPVRIFLTLSPSSRTSGYIDGLLTQESLNWHLSASSSSNFWPHWDAHTYSGIIFCIVPNLVSESQIFPSWVPAFLISAFLSNFALWNLFFVFFENPAHLFTDSFHHFLVKGERSCK